MTSATVKKLLSWKPGLFPEGFSVEDGQYIGFGIPVTIWHEILTESQHVGILMTVQHKKQSIAEVQDAEIERILMDLLQLMWKLRRIDSTCPIIDLTCFFPK